jgi:hypothetical protein
MEARLARLDEVAFNYLVKKAAPFVTKKNKHGSWRPLIDTLNEAFGYIYLLELGYDRIEFISTHANKTPDFWGLGPAGSVVLEVKTIGRSDVDRQNAGEVTEGLHELPVGFTTKLRSTYLDACEQLTSYKPDDLGIRRICYFVIDVDLSCALHCNNRISLENYLTGLTSEGIEISALSRHW